ncbi:hypothetical protein QPL94_07655 [Marinobacter sp. SS13-12]|nr:hypothetical protein [Marinobacter sp. SS13-12]
MSSNGTGKKVANAVWGIAKSLGSSVLQASKTYADKGDSFKKMNLAQLRDELKKLNRDRDAQNNGSRSLLSSIIAERERRVDAAKEQLNSQGLATVSGLGESIKKRPAYDPVGDAARDLLDRMARTGDIAAADAVRILKNDKHW